MSVRAALMASLIFTMLTLVPAGAHLMSLPNKIGMAAPDYLIAQQAYAGWNLAAVLVVGALISTGLLNWLSRTHQGIFTPAIIAFTCVIATQIVFWTLNFPANQQTTNWTQLPAHWETLRRRWEIGHALSALLNLVTLTALLIATWRLFAFPTQTDGR